MQALDMTASGSPEEKLRWAFKMFDKDCSGKHETKYCGNIINVVEVIFQLLILRSSAKPSSELRKL